MYLKDKIFGISTKNLYIGQLAKQYVRYKSGGVTYTAELYNKNYVLVRQKDKYWDQKQYKDVFTSSVYNKINQFENEDHEIVVVPVKAVNIGKKRIKYHDAELLIDRLNFTDEEDKIKVKR